MSVYGMMKIKTALLTKPVLLFIIAVILASALASCESGKMHIEDTNGADDVSLCTLTEEDILGRPSYISYMSIENSVNDSYRLTVDKLSGVSEAKKITVGADAVTLTYTVEVSEGNLRVCIVKDGAVVADLAVNGGEQQLTLSEKGTYRVIVAGESAKIAFALSQDS